MFASSVIHFEGWVYSGFLSRMKTTWSGLVCEITKGIPSRVDDKYVFSKDDKEGPVSALNGIFIWS